MRPAFVRQQSALEHTAVEEEDSGLMFVDPEEEKKAQKEREKLFKKKEAPVLKLAGNISIQGGLHQGP